MLFRSVADTDKTTGHKEIKNYNYILRDNNLWQLPKEKLSEYQENFPGIDVDAELLRAKQWCADNPARRKTAQCMPKFLSGWLGRQKPQPKADDRPAGLPEPDTRAILRGLGGVWTDEKITEWLAEGNTL